MIDEGADSRSLDHSRRRDGLMSKTPFAVAIAAVLLLASAPARAEVLLTPFAGKAFSGSLDTSRTTYGGSLAFLGGGVLGFEAEFGYVKNFFGDLDISEAVDSNSVQSLSANLMVSVPSGSLRPYGAAGLSLLRPALTGRSGFVVVDQDKVGYNIGGGLLILFSDHVGLRGDLRYFRTFGDISSGNEISLGPLDYWRGIGGLTFRF
jgi:opacity protein-like surface antigen